MRFAHNARWCHSGLGCLSPAEVERRYRTDQRIA
jgi:hypothetical protein